MSESLMELFREELRAHGRALAAELARGGADRGALRRAAHSIRGAAHIVSLDALESLAAAIEESLGADRESGALAAVARSALADAVELFAAAAELADDEIETWLSTRRTAFDALADRIRGTGAVRPRRRAARSGVRADAGMLELFRQETEAHAATLDQGLLALEADPGHLELLESLMRAAHSIKGAARVVGLDGGVELAHAVEDALVAVKQGRLALGGDDFDLLLRAADLLVQLAAATGLPPRSPRCYPPRRPSWDRW